MVALRVPGFNGDGRLRPDSRTQAALKESIREIHAVGLGQAVSAGSEAITIGVTSPDYGDGKTTVATALAGGIANDYNTDVMLVDGDFHTHSIAADFGLGDGDGLAEVIAGRRSLEDVTHRLPGGGLSVVTAGHISADPARLARSEHLIAIIENMKRASKYVVIDLPATLRSMNAPVLAQRCDGVIVVVRYGHTAKADLDRTLHLLRGANVLGVVMNRYKSTTPRWVGRALGLRS